jgi:hypothetical protein
LGAVNGATSFPFYILARLAAVEGISDISEDISALQVHHMLEVPASLAQPSIVVAREDQQRSAVEAALC